MPGITTKMPVGGHLAPTPDLPVSMSSSEQQESPDMSVCPRDPSQEGEGQNWRGEDSLTPCSALSDNLVLVQRA